MSWRKYLQESRLLQAMALLAGGDDNLLAIAVAVGFDSASAFSRAFGRYVGESPHTYRRRIRSAEFRALPDIDPLLEGGRPGRQGVVALREGPGPVARFDPVAGASEANAALLC